MFADLLLWAILACFFLFLPQEAAQGAATGLHICATAIIPTLFPFFVLINFWIQSGFGTRLSALLSSFTEKFFHLPSNAFSALLLGSIGGYPIGAKTASQLYTEGQLSKDEAEQTLLFCNNAGPAFVIGVLGTGVFQNTFIGVFLYILHLLAACLTGLLLRPKRRPQSCSTASRSIEPSSLPQRWTSSITNAGTTAILVCTYVIFFAIVTQCITHFLPTSSWTTVLTGLLELAGGANMLRLLPLQQTTIFILAAFLLGFGGVCVMLQSLSILQAAGLSGKKLLLGKSAHAIVSGILAAAVSPILPLKQSCTAGLSPLSVGMIEQLILIGLLLFFCVIFLKESSGKTEKNPL